MVVFVYFISTVKQRHVLSSEQVIASKATHNTLQRTFLKRSFQNNLIDTFKPDQHVRHDLEICSKIFEMTLKHTTLIHVCLLSDVC